jgi:hypothetical protein
VPFPSKKEEIEKLVAHQWLAEAQKTDQSIRGYMQNEQDNFDLTVSTDSGDVSMDLVEFVYRDQQGCPYEGQNLAIAFSDFASQIRDTVKKKSDHYGKASGRPIYLLVYVTHWRFVPAHPDLIALAQYFIATNPTIMEKVYFLAPMPRGGISFVLFPSHDPLRGRDPVTIGKQVFHMAAPQQYSADPQAGTITIRF